MILFLISANVFVNNNAPAKYGCKSKEDWPYRKAKLLIQESIEKSQSVDIDNLEKRLAEEAELLLGDAIACAYLSVLQDCEAHCLNEGAEVKRLGGLHVIGTSLHESRRIDNQVSTITLTIIPYL